MMIMADKIDDTTDAQRLLVLSEKLHPGNVRRIWSSICIIYT